MSVLAEEKPLTLSAGDGKTAEASDIVYNGVEIKNGEVSENGGSPMTQGGSTGDGTNGSSVDKVERAPGKRGAVLTHRSRKKTKAGRYTSDITYEEMEKYFHLPGEKAAKELGVGLTILKRLCRKFGLARWPYKKPTKKAVEMERMRLLRDYSDMVGGVYGAPAWMNPGVIQHAQGPAYGTQGTWRPNVFPHATLPMQQPSFGYTNEPRFFQPVPNRASSDNWRWNIVLERLGILSDEKPNDFVTQNKPSRGFVPLRAEFSLRKPTEERYFEMAARNKDMQYVQAQEDNNMNLLSSRNKIEAILNARAAANSTFRENSPVKAGATNQKAIPPSQPDNHQQLEESIRLVAQDPGLRDTIKHLLEALDAQRKKESQAN